MLDIDTVEKGETDQTAFKDDVSVCAWQITV